MRRISKIMVVVGFFVLLAMTPGCKKQTGKNDKTPATGKRIAVQKTAKPEIEAFGMVKAQEIQDISIDFPARVAKLLVKEGQKVSPGQSIVQLDLKDYMVQIRNKEQELNSARFDLQKSRKDLRDAKEDYEKAHQQLNRKENLFQDGVISRQEVDDYRDILKNKEKAVTDLQLNLDETGDFQSGHTAISLKQQKIVNLEAELAALRNKLKQNYIRQDTVVSLVNGVVYDLGYVAGDQITIDKKVLGIMRLDGLIVDADVAEEFIKDVRIGAAATIVPVADNSRKYQGTVRKIAGMATKQNGETTVSVEIAIVKPDDFLQPNYNVDVAIAK